MNARSPLATSGVVAALLGGAVLLVRERPATADEPPPAAQLPTAPGAPPSAAPAAPGAPPIAPTASLPAREAEPAAPPAEPEPASPSVTLTEPQPIVLVPAEGPPLPSAAPPPPPPRPVPLHPPYAPANFSVLWPLATNLATPDVWTHLDVGLVLGRVGFVDGLQLAPLAFIAYDLRGAQLGGASIAGHHAQGLQLGGIFAYADGGLEGAQIAGLVGWSTEKISGLELAGAGNQSYGDIEGAQVAGVGNLARGDVTGAQAAGLFNIGRVEGLQLGAVNVSQQVKGLQVGLINVARRIDGLQVGVINVTDDLRGESIGLAPIPRRGGIHVVAWGSNSLYGNVGVKFSSVYAYSILSFALHNTPGDTAAAPPKPVYGGGMTVGARVPLASSFFLSGDLGAYRLFQDRVTFSGHDEVVKVRVLVSYEIAHRLTPFFGAGAQAALRGEPVSFSAGPELCAGLEL